MKKRKETYEKHTNLKTKIIKDKNNMNNKINVKKEGEIITIKPEETGSISHTFRILGDRATLIESPHNNTLKYGLSFTVAATTNEIKKLILVLETLQDILLGNYMEQELNKEQLLESGTWVKTCDDRYGRIKKIDWFSEKVMKRKDYQIEFPNGVGIFRRDEIVPIE